VSSQSPSDLAADRILSSGNGLKLAVRTSMMSEFRDAAGTLGAFELSHHFTTAGALRTALSQLPGVQFDTEAASLWSAVRNRFTYKSIVYEISIPFGDIRVAPAEAGAVHRETEELFRMLADSLLPKWQNRSRSRYFGL
jgi:hypothetical protein